MPDALSARREAAALATQRWRDRNRDAINAARRQARADTRAYVAALKVALPCADCGSHFPAVCMDFDHVRGTKVANVARIVADANLDRLKDEIAKCDLVCANCHRLRTSSRSQHKEAA